MKKNPEAKTSSDFSIESLGGTGGLVTGSFHMVTVEHSKMAVDCGMCQGAEGKLPTGENRNSLNRGNLGKGLTHIMITHPHIDHTGLLPKIFKEGFTPTIMATEEAAAFMEPMLENSADIQKSGKPKDRLYEMPDVRNTLRHIRVVKPFSRIAVGQKRSGVSAEFLPNGHVMGSASVVIRSPDGKKVVLFTGDMGKPEQSLCGGYNDFVDRYPDDPINTMVVESTNFEKEPVTFEEKRLGLISQIDQVWAGGGNPVLPTLSFHRSQEIMEIIHNSQENGDIPKDCKIFIDAPLAMKLLDTFKELGPDHLSRAYGGESNFYKTQESSIARFELENVTVIDSHQSSIKNDRELANYPGKAIIIASGGMAGYGRAINYLHGEFAKNPKNAVILTCYQVKGTEGASLLDNGSVHEGRAEGAKVYQVQGFTSHISGPRETFDFLENFNLSELNKVIITHGKDSSREAMAQEFKRRKYSAEIILSKIGQVIEV